MDLTSPYAIFGYCVSVLAAAAISSIKILTNCALKRQNRQQAHEITMAKNFADHENVLATKFEGIANSFKDYAASEREDRKAANNRVMEIHGNTIEAMSEFKEVVTGMRVALDHNTKVIEDKIANDLKGK